MSYSGNKTMNCNKCGKKTTWVKCSNCNGKGNTMTTTCGNNCASGYKCQSGANDKWHS